MIEDRGCVICDTSAQQEEVAQTKSSFSKLFDVGPNHKRLKCFLHSAADGDKKAVPTGTKTSGALGPSLEAAGAQECFEQAVIYHYSSI